MKSFRVITSLFYASLLFFGVGSISFFILISSQSALAIIAAIIIGIIGLVMSRFLFNLMMRRGVISVLAGSYSSYELDEIKSTPNSSILKIQPSELHHFPFEKHFQFQQGLKINIWGDWEGRSLEKRHHIESIIFDEQAQWLTIRFLDGCLLKIKNPSPLHVARSYLKIIKAQEIQWITPTLTNATMQYIYINDGKNIITQSNNGWKPHQFDIGIGMNALYLQA
ncbi:hypothetical protein [Brumimicrobium sp.]|uniref:hypothetical protein n=1 Tax=Brumimicrobium sp. TaxID=2029867 RepID=UPI003A8D8636